MRSTEDEDVEMSSERVIYLFFWNSSNYFNILFSCKANSRYGETRQLFCCCVCRL